MQNSEETFASAEEIVLYSIVGSGMYKKMFIDAYMYNGRLLRLLHDPGEALKSPLAAPQ